jgi:hypothetical protein
MHIFDRFQLISSLLVIVMLFKQIGQNCYPKSMNSNWHSSNLPGARSDLASWYELYGSIRRIEINQFPASLHK